MKNCLVVPSTSQDSMNIEVLPSACKEAEDLPTVNDESSMSIIGLYLSAWLDALV